ncbi:MAG: hypothetical protein AB1638_12520, partial [Nitrospirota bacterium]
SLHLLHKRGTMHHDESKKVLFVSMDPEEIGRTIGMDLPKVTEIINNGKVKLLRERNRREAPFVDRTFYTSLNGMLISSYLRAYRTLKDKDLKDFALKSLEGITKKNLINNELFHSDGVKGLLEDYIFLIEALINAYEVTGNSTYLKQADELMELSIWKFWDKDEGGFFDTDEDILGIRLKGIEDVPHPSADSLGIMLLLKLYFMTEKQIYYKYAEKALKAFSATAKGTGIHSEYYFCAVDAFFNMIKLSLQTAPSSDLAEEALFPFIPYRSITYGEDKGSVVPCLGQICYEPIGNPESLRKFLESLPELVVNIRTMKYN